MAILKCTCGNGMSNSNDPNDYIVNVYKKSDVDDILKDDPQIRLIDFDTLDWEYEYWYCPECGRLHIVENIPCGKVVKRYIKKKDLVMIKSRDYEWEEYYIFSNVEMYDAEETDVTLYDFVNNVGASHLYFVNNLKDEVYKENENGEYVLVYEKEKTQ